MGKTISHCYFCKEKVGLTVQETVAEGVALVPLDVKQKLMDGIKEGKTLGDAMRFAGVQGYKGMNDLMIAGEIVMRQIVSKSFLDYEVKGVKIQSGIKL